MIERIAVVKTAWSDDYVGEMPRGRHANIQIHGDAHERFNFLKRPDGRYYGYLPPMGKKERAPQPEIADNWLLVFVAAQEGTGPLVVVGWYEDATIHDEYQPRPEYTEDQGFPLDIHRQPYSYCLTARRAHLIPTGERTNKVSGDHIRRAPIIYLRGGSQADQWREAMARRLESLVSSRTREPPKPVPNLKFPDAKHRGRVERAAVDAVETFLGKTHHVDNREKEKCGYDLHAQHRTTDEVWLVEVKGTSGENGHFYMTKNEKNFMEDPRWRLAMVTNALASPQIELLDARRARKLFILNPFAWEGILKVKA